MDKTISIEKVLKNLRKSEFILNCRMPMGYAQGLPVLQVRNNYLCLLVPYFKTHMTGEVDKTLVFPIRYAVTLELPEEKVIKYEDISFYPVFGKVDFSKPIGYFRHDAVKQFNKTQYLEKKKELLGLYSKVANNLLFGSGLAREDEERMKELLQILVEPSLLPQYRVLDRDFYDKYLAHDV